MQENKKRKMGFPTAYTVLFIVLILAAALTYLVPSGKYSKLSFDEGASSFVITNPQGETKELPGTQETLKGLNVNVDLEQFTSGTIYKPIAIPGTYQQVEANPTSIKDFFLAPIHGFYDVKDIMLFVLILGGLIGVMNTSGAINAGFAALSRVTKGKEYVLIVLTTFLIALGGTTYGMAEETIALYPIIIPIFIVAGYDALIGIAAIYLGSNVGCMFSTVNVFATGIGSAAAGTTPAAGMTFRIIGLAIGTIICIVYMLRYASKVRKDPTNSLIYEQREEIEAHIMKGSSEEVPALTGARSLMLLIFLASFFIMTYGVSSLGWWFDEMSTLFLVSSILIILIAIFFTGYSEKETINSFVSGAADLIGVGLIIGIARGVNFILDQGYVSDTILYNATQLVTGMSPTLFVVVMMFIFIVLGFFIPSTSGLAVLSMPIMAPLADTVGLPRDIIVSAFQYGQGLMGFITPTGLILVVLSLVNVTYNKWLKLVIPLVGILTVLAIGMLLAQAHLG